MTAAIHRFCQITPHPTACNWNDWGLEGGALIARGLRLRQSAKTGAGGWWGLVSMVVGDRGGVNHLHQGHEPPGGAMFAAKRWLERER
jgi:hypothetical protein